MEANLDELAEAMDNIEDLEVFGVNEEDSYAGRGIHFAYDGENYYLLAQEKAVREVAITLPNILRDYDHPAGFGRKVQIKGSSSEEMAQMAYDAVRNEF